MRLSYFSLTSSFFNSLFLHAAHSQCSEECQKKDWDRHKRQCCPVFANVNKTFRKMHLSGGPKPKPFLYEANSFRGKFEAGELIALSETSLAGSTQLLLNLGPSSRITFMEQDPASMLQNVREDQTRQMIDNALEFRQLDDLPVLERFLVACGPFQDLAVAKSSLEGALSKVNGNLHALRIRGGCFTALEWAAKKGSIDIVEWLCTDVRTKDLIRIGSPAGWACYTGQNPSATRRGRKWSARDYSISSR